MSCNSPTTSNLAFRLKLNNGYIVSHGNKRGQNKQQRSGEDLTGAFQLKENQHFIPQPKDEL